MIGPRAKSGPKHSRRRANVKLAGGNSTVMAAEASRPPDAEARASISGGADNPSRPPQRVWRPAGRAGMNSEAS